MAIPGAGVYAQQQTAAEQAYEAAMAKLNSQYGGALYQAGYVKDASGAYQPSGDPYSDLSQMKTAQKYATEDYDTARQRFFEDLDASQQYLQEDYTRNAKQLEQQKYYAQQDAARAGQALNRQSGELQEDNQYNIQRLQKNYALGIARLGRQEQYAKEDMERERTRASKIFNQDNARALFQKEKFLRDSDLARTDLLTKEGRTITAARAAGVARGLGTHGLGAQGVSEARSDMLRALLGWRLDREDFVKDWDLRQQEAAQNFAEVGQDNSYKLQRTLDEIADQRTEMKTDLDDTSAEYARQLARQLANISEAAMDQQTAMQRQLLGFSSQASDNELLYNRSLNELAKKRARSTLDFDRQSERMLNDFGVQQSQFGKGIAELIANQALDSQGLAAQKNWSMIDAEQQALASALENQDYSGGGDVPDLPDEMPPEVIQSIIEAAAQAAGRRNYFEPI